LGNEVLLNATLLFIFFILLKISNILTGCYNPWVSINYMYHGILKGTK